MMQPSSGAYKRQSTPQTWTAITMMSQKKKITTKLPQENYCRYIMNKADIHKQLDATIMKNNRNNYHYKIDKHTAASAATVKACIKSILTCCAHYTVNQKPMQIPQRSCQKLTLTCSILPPDHFCYFSRCYTCRGGKQH